jgi:putative aldouronate transport system permease protein
VGLFQNIVAFALILITNRLAAKFSEYSLWQGGGMNLRRIGHNPGGFLFDSLNWIFMTLVCFTMLYPFLYLLALSLSSGSAGLSTVSFYPRQPTLGNYISMLSYKFIRTGAFNSVLRVILGVSANLFFETITAYPLSKKTLPHRPFWTGLFVFTMFFSGGLIPTYILFVNLKLTNTIWALVLTGMIPVFSVLLIRNNFMASPPALEESARMDGAGEFRILARILVPLIKPILATVALWAIVGHWNAWFDSMIYMRDMGKQVLQVVMRNIVIAGTMDTQTAALSYAVTPETLKAATVMITTIPVICAYPFLQKYFVKGIMIGSLKG